MFVRVFGGGGLRRLVSWFAGVCGVVCRVEGCGVWRSGCRSVVSFVAVVLGVLVFAVVPAWAVPPEAPESGLAEPGVLSVVLHGVLNPNATVTQPGSYQFSYAQSATECTPGTLEPGSPELAIGAKGEEESVTVTGLEANQQYAFCIVAYGLFGGVTEPAYGAVMPFKTLAAPPTVASESAFVTSTTASLEAQVNPNNERTSYVFEYSTTEAAGVLTGSITTLTGATPLVGGTDQAAVAPKIEALAPGTTYYYRVVAKNAQSETEGKPSAGVVEKFVTVPTPTVSPVTLVGTTTATFNGTLKPLNEEVETEYEFEYNIGEDPACSGESHTAPVNVGTGAGTEVTASTAVTGLQADQQYTVCLITKNEFGPEVASAPVHFDTLAAPPTIEAGSETASAAPFEATLQARVNPNNQPTTYVFEYSTSEAGGHLTGTIVKLVGGGALNGGTRKTASVVTGAVLTPATTYFFRVSAENASGHSEGAGEFATPALAAPSIEYETSSGVTTELATLETSVNPEYQAATCSFEYGTEPALGAHTSTVACPKPLGSGGAGVIASVKLTGLSPASTYYYRVTATNHTGTTTDPTIETFATAPATAPTVESESVSTVEATTAAFEAKIAPGAAVTTYEFDYLTEAQYTANGDTFTGASTASGAKPIPAEEVSELVAVRVTGLQPATSYEYRVVATNTCEPGKQCVTAGPAKTLVTTEGPSTAPETCLNAQRRAEQPDAQDLPDCRAYEMVSPVQTAGQDATEPPSLLATAGSFRASESHGKEADGTEETPAVTYPARGAIAGPAVGSTFIDQSLSRREPEHDRWSTQSITPPVEGGINIDNPYNGVFFTPELTEGLTSIESVLPPGEAPQGLQELYLANYTDSSYQLVSNLPGDEQEKDYDEADRYGHFGLSFAGALGASTDLSHVVFVVGDLDSENGVYVDLEHNGQVFPVGVSNSGEQWPLISIGDAGGSLAGDDVWRAVSADGSRVVFNHERGPREPGELYIRQHGEQPQSAMNGEECLEPTDACTIKLSPGVARYWGADTEDTKILYTEGGPGNEDLYEYTLPPGQATGHVTAITHAGKVQGVVQVSEDASHVYFVAKAVLTGEEENQHHEKAQSEADNLYLTVDGHTTYIATLSNKDTGVWERGPGEDEAVTSPDGVRLAFASELSLTGYDNQQAESGECERKAHIAQRAEDGRCVEVYLYDAETNTLACASCDPSGALPVGGANLTTGDLGSDYRPRALLEDGALFFDSSDALMPHASGGHSNVYDYEDGRVYPISNVDGSYQSFFLDASPDGQDVFFASADRLLPQDEGENIVVWDAREGGGFPVTSTPSPCENSASCQPPATPQPSGYSPAGSATFNGPGNLVPAPASPAGPGAPKPLSRAQRLARALKGCRKEPKRKRVACEREARKRFGVSSSAKGKKKHG
jgi:hypothetical protein